MFAHMKAQANEAKRRKTAGEKPPPSDGPKIVAPFQPPKWPAEVRAT